MRHCPITRDEQMATGVKLVKFILRSTLLPDGAAPAEPITRQVAGLKNPRIDVSSAEGRHGWFGRTGQSGEAVWNEDRQHWVVVRIFGGKKRRRAN